MLSVLAQPFCPQVKLELARGVRWIAEALLRAKKVKRAVVIFVMMIEYQEIVLKY